MAGTEGDIISVTLHSLWQSQVTEMVFFYRVEDTPTAGYLEGLATEFEDNGLPIFALAQSVNMEYVQLTVRNIFNLDEFVKSPLVPDDGTLSAGADLPSFMSANIKLVRSNARVRHGRKAFGGATENEIGGQQWETAYVALLQDCADWMAEEQIAGGVDFFKPVIVGRVFVPADPPDIPNAYYRLPTSQVEMGDNWAYVISALASPFASTQRSRKLGHGS